jgi:hypothetical protein
MQKNHSAPRGAEDDSGDPVAGETTAKLPKPTSERPAKRHSNRPAKFNQTQVPAQNLPVGGGKALQPIFHQFRTRRSAVEVDSYLLCVFFQSLSLSL